MTYEQLLEELKGKEFAIKMATTLRLLDTYERIDLELKIIDLKIKLLNHGKHKTNDRRKTKAS